MKVQPLSLAQTTRHLNHARALAREPRPPPRALLLRAPGGPLPKRGHLASGQPALCLAVDAQVLCRQPHLSQKLPHLVRVLFPHLLDRLATPLPTGSHKHLSHLCTRHLTVRDANEHIRLCEDRLVLPTPQGRHTLVLRGIS